MTITREEYDKGIERIAYATRDRPLSTVTIEFFWLFCKNRDKKFLDDNLGEFVNSIKKPFDN